MSGSSQARRPVFTVGHSTRSIDQFVALIAAHGVETLIDVRTVPRSRTNPQFNKDVLPKSLAAHNIDYVHMPELGGLRKPAKDSVNGGWRNASFRGYADYMQTGEFAAAIKQLVAQSRAKQIALMCAEAVPWRCHRCLIADALVVRGIPVDELASPTRRQPHQMTRFAQVSGTKIIYPTDPAHELLL